MITYGIQHPTSAKMGAFIVLYCLAASIRLLQPPSPTSSSFKIQPIQLTASCDLSFARPRSNSRASQLREIERVSIVRVINRVGIKVVLQRGIVKASLRPVGNEVVNRSKRSAACHSPTSRCAGRIIGITAERPRARVSAIVTLHVADWVRMGEGWRGGCNCAAGVVEVVGAAGW